LSLTTVFFASSNVDGEHPMAWQACNFCAELRFP